MGSTALDIYQDHLDTTSAMLMRGEHQALSQMFTIPNQMETLDGLLEFNAPDEVITATQAFAAYIARMGGSDFFRICLGATFTDARQCTITGNHESYILAGGTYAVEPYINELTLELEHGRWLESKIRTLSNNATVAILSSEQLRERALAKAQETKGNTSND